MPYEEWHNLTCLESHALDIYMNLKIELKGYGVIVRINKKIVICHLSAAAVKKHERHLKKDTRAVMRSLV